MQEKPLFFTPQIKGILVWLSCFLNTEQTLAIIVVILRTV